MSVSVGDTLEDAVGRLMTVPGLLVLVLFAVFRLSNPVIYNTFFARGAEFVLEKAGGYSLRDVEIELVERGYSELLPLVDEILSGLFGTYVRSLIASFIALFLILLGSAFFLLPGLALAVLFLFVRQRIALAGDGIFEALSESYDLVTQNALQMVALVVVFWLTWVVTTFIAGMIPLGDLSSQFGRLVETIIIVFGISLFTSAYLQAVGGRGGRASAVSADQSESLGV